MTLTVALLAAQVLGLKFAKADLTPVEPLPLGGYTDRKGANFEPGGQQLFARVTEIGDIVFVSLELLTIPRGFYDEVQKELSGRKLFLVATHTHCAPDSQMLNPKMNFAVPGIASFRPSVAKWYRDKVVGAVRAADSAPEVKCKKLELKTTPLDQNHARREGGTPDKTAWLLSGSKHTLFASYAAHATFHEPDWLKLDGDWPGLLASSLKAPVFPGAIGDVSPEAPGDGPVEKCRNLVENFVCRIRKARPKTVWHSGEGVGFCEVPIKLDPPKPHAAFAKTYGVPDALAQVLVSKFAESKANVTAAVWGSFLVVGVPGEPTSAVGAEIQSKAEKMGFPHCLVLSHVNGWIGYILKPEDYDRGGYEATLSFNGRETADRVEEAAEAAIEQLAQP